MPSITRQTLNVGQERIGEGFMKNGRASTRRNKSVSKAMKVDASQPRNEDINEAVSTLDQWQDSAILTAVWPAHIPPASLTQAVRLAGGEKLASEYDQTLLAAKAHREVGKCPILAVLGQLNAGKSSVVAGFLSEAGRKRVPRGTDDRFGTHRFVYWVPSSWMNDAATKQAFLDLLTAAHGKGYELLSPDPQEAEQQYRSGRDDVKKMQIPLIAHDDALDGIEAAFLDCPDVQTKDRSSRLSADGNPRLDFIGSAARVCSAFLLVWDRSQLRDDLLSQFLATIRGRMADAPLYLLINMITPESGQPTLTRNDANLTQILSLYSIEQDACYGAFHFRVGPQDGEPGWRDLTPQVLVERFDEMDRRFGKDGRFPQFFSLALEEDRNVPAAVESGRFLENLPHQLDVAQLQEQKLHDHWRELCVLGKANIEAASAYVERTAAETKRVHEGLLDLCWGLFTDESGEPLQIPSEAFGEAFRESFERTAPRGMKWVLNLQSLLKRALQAVKKKFDSLPFRKWLNKLWSTKDAVRTGLEDLGIGSGRMEDPESLAHDMRTRRWVPDDVDEQCLVSGWKQVLKQFQRHQDKAVDLDPARMDEMTAAIWESMTVWQQIRLGFKQVVDVLAIITAFAGLITALVDGGATLFTSFSLAATVSSAIPGFALLKVAGAAAAGGAAWRFMFNAIYCNTLPALSLFFALACDAFGVPRTIGDQPGAVHFGRKKASNKTKIKEFRLSKVDLKPAAPACPLGDFRIWMKTPRFDDYQKAFNDE